MIRELKLYDLCGESTVEVLELNAFFVELFSDLSIYTKNNKPDLIFMKDDKFIMEQDLENGYLWCSDINFWLFLESNFKLEYSEIQEVISYKIIGMVEEAFKMGSLIPEINVNYYEIEVEEAFKMGSLTPNNFELCLCSEVEEAFKIGSLTPVALSGFALNWVDEAFKMGSLTPKPNQIKSNTFN